MNPKYKHVYIEGKYATKCSHLNCPRSAQSWYYTNSKRLKMTFIFGRCDLHNEREYAGQNTDIAGWFVPNDAVSMKEEDVAVFSVMQS